MLTNPISFGWILLDLPLRDVRVSPLTMRAAFTGTSCFVTGTGFPCQPQDKKQNRRLAVSYMLSEDIEFTADQILTASR